MQDANEQLQKICNMNAVIASSTQQQQTAVAEVTRNLSQIEDNGQRTAEDAKRVAGESQQLLQMADQLTKSLANFNASGKSRGNI